MPFEAKGHAQAQPKTRRTPVTLNESIACDRMLQAGSVWTKYSKTRLIGRGSYGEVILARRKDDGEQVAVKRAVVCRDDRASRQARDAANREIGFLKSLSHVNIVKLYAVYREYDTRSCASDRVPSDAIMVLEYCELDMGTLLHRARSLKRPFPVGDISTIAKELFSGLAYCHDRLIVHRDLKPNNLLLKMCPQLKRYRLKLADFGMCRRLNFPLREYTPDRITFAYRPPELLYGSGLYGPEIDVWSAGCIIAELVRDASLFGEMTTSDLSVLTSIQQKLGDPKREDIRYLKKCAANAHIPVVSPTPDHPLEYHVPGLPEAGIDLLKKIFVYDVSKRLDAVEVLQHKFLDISFDENDSFLKCEQSWDKESTASPFPVFPAISEIPGLLPTPDDSYRRPPPGVAVHENLGGLAMFTNSKPRQFTNFGDDVSGTWFFNDDGGECTYQAGR